MASYTIPNTTVKASILEPSKPMGHANIYLDSTDQQKGRVLGSVNAGTSNFGEVFAVGLGGINGGFKKDLSDAGQDTQAYQSMHEDLYNAATNGQGVTGQFKDPSYPALFSYVQKPDPSYNLFEYDGTVFTDIFTSGTYPNSNANNYAMIYVVPPNRSNYNSDFDFLEAVAKTNLTLIKCVAGYNEYITKGHPGTKGLQAINTIRMCLFSGSIYRGSAGIKDVAVANLTGLEQGFGNDPTAQSSIQEVEFENSYIANGGQYAFEGIKSLLTLNGTII